MTVRQSKHFSLINRGSEDGTKRIQIAVFSVLPALLLFIYLFIFLYYLENRSAESDTTDSRKTISKLGVWIAFRI